MHIRTRATALALIVSVLSANSLAQTDASTQPQPQTQTQTQPQPQTQTQTQTQTAQTQPPPPQVTIRTVVTPTNATPTKDETHRPMVDFVSLRLMREKHIITEAEYRAARDEIGASIGDRADEGMNLVVGKWSAQLYGFIDSDFIFDSTQSFNDLAGNALVQRPIGSPPPAGQGPLEYAGNNPRAQFSIRNSRFGLRLRAPEVAKVRATATLEMDFLGTDPAPSNGGSTSATDAGFFNNPTLRVRHAYLKMETPIVDILIGQYWHMFGWQGAYFPPTVEIQGLPGQLYERTAQLRLSHKFSFGDHSALEIAGAALRPPTRDGFIPDFAGGLRFSFEKWRGIQTFGATSTQVAPASLAVTGDFRDFRSPDFEAFPKQTIELPTGAIAIDAFIPIIPATTRRRGNSLSISGEFVYGGGISDMYTGLTGGITFPSLINTTTFNPAPPYPQNVDNGMVIIDNNAHTMHAIIWTTAMGGLQYYLPGVDGRVWVTGNYAHIESPNIDQFTQTVAPNPGVSNYTQAASVRKSEDWVDANVFVEPLASVRLGVEYAAFLDHYVDGVTATNHRVQVSGFFLF